MKKEIHLKRNLRFLCLTFALDRLLPKVSSKLLDYFIHVNEEFIKFRQERFIEKSNLPSEAIKKKFNLPKFTEASCNQKQVSNKSVVKSNKRAI